MQTRIRRKDGTENFGGFRICDGWISTTGFCVVGFYVPDSYRSILCLFCLFFFLFSGYHAKGYHAPSILHGLSRPGLSRLYHHCTATTPVYIYPGYHAIVLSSIPGLSHLSYHAPPHTYIGLSHPPYLVVRSLPIIGYHPTSSSPPTPPPGRHTYQPTPQSVSLCVSRGPPLGTFVSCLGNRRGHNGRRRQ